MPAVPDQPVSLRDITQENFVPVVNLSVKEEQKGFVATNVFSIAEAKVYPEHFPTAIYAGETLVGFVMYGPWQERSQYWINRMMIDQQHQGKGYGYAAMQLVIERMRAQFGCEEIYLSYDPNNAGARSLYIRLGFVPTGAVEEGEEVACWKRAQV